MVQHGKKTLKNAVRRVTLSECNGVGFTTLGCGESFSIFVQDILRNLRTHLKGTAMCFLSKGM